MGAWDPIWDTIFEARQWGKYPKEELIRFVARHFYPAPDRWAVRFLDLGCGFGSSTWYLAREGFAVQAIDGSKIIIDRLRERLEAEGLSADLAVGDVIDLPYPSQSFDCVIDIACLQHNNPADTRRILDGIFDRLKPGGRLFSFSASSGCWGDGLGIPMGDNTYSGITEGPFANAGVARFSTEQQIRDLYWKFELQLDMTELTVNGRAHRLSYWLIEGFKS
jgi:SAM-dependent methyltransferase